MFKAPHLQALLEEVQGIRKGLADDSRSTATKQVFKVPCLLSVWRHDPVISAFQGTVAGELQARVWEDGDHSGSQAFVEDERALRPIHGAYGLSQIAVDLPMHMHSVSEGTW